MARLYGQSYTRAELLQRVGDISQIARAKPYRLAEGHEEGVLAIDVSSGSGLEFTILAGRGMDISTARHKGRPLAWRSPTSDQHAAYFEPQGRGWLRSFFGGLVLTCGLTWMGADCVDEGEPLGIHGRVSHLPATSVSWDGVWEGDDYLLTVRGKVREAIVFGENIQMTRTIRTRLGEDRFFLEDVVENQGFERAPHMILYHINLGFPVVGDNSRLVAPTVRATPRDAEAEAGKERLAFLQPPTESFREKVYFHELQADADGCVTTAVVNPDVDGGFGVYCRYEHSALPWFTEWKMMGQGTYVLGMEPGNALVLGRATERREGRLQFLEPGESRTYRLEIGVVEGPEAIRALESAARVS